MTRSSNSAEMTKQDCGQIFPQSNRHSPVLGGPSSSPFQEFVGLLGADAPQKILRLISVYLDETSQLILRLHGAIAEDDPVDLLLAAHTLKSSRALAGAQKLSAVCAETEQVVGEGIDASDIADLVTTVENEHRRLWPEYTIPRIKCSLH